MRWKTGVLWIAALGVVALLGVQAGRRVLQWRVDRAHDDKLAGLDVGHATALRPGQPFPDVELTAPNGQRVGSRTIGGDGRAIAVFVSVGCDACSEALQRWSEQRDELPQDVAVVAISDGSFDQALGYAKRNQLAFELFADEADVFSLDHGVDVVPTAVGIDADGTIRFVRHGLAASFGLDDAVAALDAQTTP